MKKTALAITTAALALGALVSTAPLAHADWDGVRGDRHGSYGRSHDRDCDRDDRGTKRYGYGYGRGYDGNGYNNYRYDRYDYGRYDYPRYRYEPYRENYGWYRGWWR